MQQCVLHCRLCLDLCRVGVWSRRICRRKGWNMIHRFSLRRQCVRLTGRKADWTGPSAVSTMPSRSWPSRRDCLAVNELLTFGGSGTLTRSFVGPDPRSPCLDTFTRIRNVAEVGGLRRRAEGHTELRNPCRGQTVACCVSDKACDVPGKSPPIAAIRHRKDPRGLGRQARRR